MGFTFRRTVIALAIVPSKGVHRYQCIFHPWMRTTVTVLTPDRRWYRCPLLGTTATS